MHYFIFKTKIQRTISHNMSLDANTRHKVVETFFACEKLKLELSWSAWVTPVQVLGPLPRREREAEKFVVSEDETSE